MGNPRIRWSAGHNDAGTIEFDNEVESAGVYGASGPAFYKNGSFLGELADTLSAFEERKFVIGALGLGGDNTTQFSKVRIKKLLLVNRKLTDDEHLQIYDNITGNTVYMADNNGALLVDDNGNYIVDG